MCSVWLRLPRRGLAAKSWSVHLSVIIDTVSTFTISLSATPVLLFQRRYSSPGAGGHRQTGYITTRLHLPFTGGIQPHKSCDNCVDSRLQRPRHSPQHHPSPRSSVPCNHHTHSLSLFWAAVADIFLLSSLDTESKHGEEWFIHVSSRVCTWCACWSSWGRVWHLQTCTYLLCVLLN